MPTVRLSEYVPDTIIPLLPDGEVILQYWQALKDYVAHSSNPLIVRKFGQFKRRGQLLTHEDRDFAVADNEPALWLYMRAKSGVEASEVVSLSSFQRKMPIAFAFKRGEKDPNGFTKVGRQDLGFAREGWKHCHLLQCSPREESLTSLRLEERFLRLLCPFNHFPFPSPRRYRMPKDWGEDEQVIAWLIWFLAEQVYHGTVKSGFQEFIGLAGGSIPEREPEDVVLSFSPKEAVEHASYLEDLEAIDPTVEYEHVISAEPELASLSRGVRFSCVEAFVASLRTWHLNTEEQTIGNAVVGATKWVYVRVGVTECYLNSDTKRSGVEAFLQNFDRGWPIVVRQSRSGRVVMVTNARDGRKISGFHLYTTREARSEGILHQAGGDR